MNQSEGSYKATILNNTIQYNLAKADPSPSLAKCLKFQFNSWIKICQHPAFKMNHIFKHSQFLHFFITQWAIDSWMIGNSSTFIFCISFTIKLAVNHFPWGNLSPSNEIQIVRFFKQHPLLSFYLKIQIEHIIILKNNCLN